MFVSDTHLPQILPPEAYHDAGFYGREMERLFRKGWHAVGVVTDVARGAEPTVHVGDVPVQLTGGDAGVSAWRLVAHGGRRLQTVRTALCGQVIFISLAETGPTLEEFLGDIGPLLATCFGPDREQVLVGDAACDCNWKVAVENGLESYHVACVHTGTFRVMPTVDACVHELHGDHTLFRTPSSRPGSFDQRLENWMAALAGESATHEYLHAKAYPALAVSRTDTVTILHSILPRSPTTCIYHYRLFMPRPGRHWWCRPLLAWLRPQVCGYWRLVLEEDRRIFPRIQAGLSSAIKPAGGLVSAREERIFHFQRFVAAGCEAT